MKTITAAILAGGAIIASQSGFASTFVPNDLYLGFQNQAGGGSQDYIINLGSASSILGSSTTVDLSSQFNSADFNAVLGGSASMFGGVVGGLQSSGTADIYLTQLRSGGAGTPSAPGSSISSTISRTTINNAVSALNPVNVPAAGSGILDSTKSWEAYVEPTFNTSTFYGASGINPDSSVSTSTVLYEDLWSAANSTLTGKKAFTYDGYFTLDVTGSNASLTFTSASVVVPEPAKFSLIAGGSLLLLALGRRSVAKNV
ncbi:MAG TPA: hypothetical protein VNX46_06170 [Candidatus Acidoferrum sp.]|nr:hypothetical protein [Candidatus Acidoferrum sp.]